MVSISTAQPGAALSRLGIASMLGVPGIVTSRSTTFGRRSWATRRASSASPASATTLKPPSLSRMRRSPPRTSAWSSASTIVIGSCAPSAGSTTVRMTLSPGGADNYGNDSACSADARRPPPVETDPTMPNRPLLLCYDGSENAKHAIREAAALLAPRKAVVLSVWQDATAIPSLAWAGDRLRRRRHHRRGQGADLDGRRAGGRGTGRRSRRRRLAWSERREVSAARQRLQRDRPPLLAPHHRRSRSWRLSSAQGPIPGGAHAPGWLHSRRAACRPSSADPCGTGSVLHRGEVVGGPAILDPGPVSTRSATRRRASMTRPSACAAAADDVRRRLREEGDE